MTTLIYMNNIDINSGLLTGESLENNTSEDITTMETVFPSEPNFCNGDWGVGDINIVNDTELKLKFMDSNCSLINAMAFYTYPTGSPPSSIDDISEIVVVFPRIHKDNTSVKLNITLPSLYTTTVNNGFNLINTVSSTTFTSGTSLGFVLINRLWRDHDSILHKTISDEVGTIFLNPSLNTLNQVKSVIKPKSLYIGFEDIDRELGTSDEDFNDVIIRVKQNSMTDISYGVETTFSNGAVITGNESQCVFTSMNVGDVIRADTVWTNFPTGRLKLELLLPSGEAYGMLVVRGNASGNPYSFYINHKTSTNNWTFQHNENYDDNNNSFLGNNTT